MRATAISEFHGLDFHPLGPHSPFPDEGSLSGCTSPPPAPFTLPPLLYSRAANYCTRGLSYRADKAKPRVYISAPIVTRECAKSRLGIFFSIIPFCISVLSQRNVPHSPMLYNEMNDVTTRTKERKNERTKERKNERTLE
jgi:hypothetical protein